MKGLKTIVALAFLAIGGHVRAQCENDRVNSGLPALLENQTVCATGVGALAGNKWQELHQGTGDGPNPLIEYARGPTDPVDPSHQVGTWQLRYNFNRNPPRPNRVEYDYGGGQVYVWSVYDNGNSTYSFCTLGPAKTEIAIATVQPSGPCP